MVLPCDYEDFKKYGVRPITDSNYKSNNSKERVTVMSENELIKEREQSEDILNGFKP